MKWLSVQTRKTGVVSSNPARVTIKTPLVRKAMGNHLTKAVSLEKVSELCLLSRLRSKSSVRRCWYPDSFIVLPSKLWKSLLASSSFPEEYEILFLTYISITF